MTSLHNRGTLAAHQIQMLCQQGAISSATNISEQLIQPASIDLTLSAEGYRMPGSVLPLPHESIADIISSLALEKLDFSKPGFLARGQVYLIKLQQYFNLPNKMESYANSKSSTGRIDLATRVLADGNPRYDRMPAGYHGELWIELIPRSFDVIVRRGDSLTQALLFTDRAILSSQELKQIHREEGGLLFNSDGSLVPDARCIHDDRVLMSANLTEELVGYVAKRSHRPLDWSKLAAHKAEDFFTPLYRPNNGYLFLEKDQFYILATKEQVRVPAHLACEMVPYDPSAGEFRAHYAGFFDPGWGCLGSATGAQAVLEVRPHEDDLILRDGQPICAMAYERLQDTCTDLYGSRNNNYAQQSGPRLSKHFE